MPKDFDNWNDAQKQISPTTPRPPLVSEREVWWASMGATVGVAAESTGKTFEWPVLILSQLSGHLFWVVRAITLPGDEDFSLKFALQDQVYSVRIWQMRTISTKRFTRKIGVVKPKEFDPIRRLCRSFWW